MGDEDSPLVMGDEDSPLVIVRAGSGSIGVGVVES